MIHYISLDTDPSKGKMYDSFTDSCITVDLQDTGARSYLRAYINENRLDVISIHQSHLPNKVQLVCWYRIPQPTARA